MRCVQGMSVTAKTEQGLRRLNNYARIHVFRLCVTSLSGFMCFVLILVFHVVIGVERLTVQQDDFVRQLNFTTHTQFQVQSSFLLDVVVRLCPVIVISYCIPNSCMFHIAKTVL